MEPFLRRACPENRRKILVFPSAATESGNLFDYFLDSGLDDRPEGGKTRKRCRALAGEWHYDIAFMVTDGIAHSGGIMASPEVRGSNHGDVYNLLFISSVETSWNPKEVIKTIYLGSGDDIFWANESAAQTHLYLARRAWSVAWRRDL